MLIDKDLYIKIKEEASEGFYLAWLSLRLEAVNDEIDFIIGELSRYAEGLPLLD